MIRKLFFVAVAAFALFLASPASARAQSAQELLQLAQQYDSIAANYERQGQSTTAQRYRQTAQLYRQLAAQMSNTSSPTPTQPKPQSQPQTQDWNQILRNAAARRDEAFKILRTMRPGRNGGYQVYFQRPPIYVGQNYGPVEGPYHIKSNDVVREITRLANNGNLLTNVGPW